MSVSLSMCSPARKKKVITTTRGGREEEESEAGAREKAVRLRHCCCRTPPRRRPRWVYSQDALSSRAERRPAMRGRRRRLRGQPAAPPKLAAGVARRVRG